MKIVILEKSKFLEQLGYENALECQQYCGRCTNHGDCKSVCYAIKCCQFQ
jgi:hypothetical protein